jgi:hypothetical protein
VSGAARKTAVISRIRKIIMTDTSPDKRNPLSADTEPSDEELAIVMREARDLALSRKRVSDEWIKTTLATVVATAHAKDGAVVKRR